MGNPELQIEKISGSRRPARYLPVLFVLLAGISLSVLLFATVSARERDLVRAEFERRAVRTLTVLQEGVDHLMEPLTSIAGLYAASREVERGEFRDFARVVMVRHRQIEALEWIPRVTDADREAYERAARKEGASGFTFTVQGVDGRLSRAPRRPEYFPVYYLEPVRGNESAFGFDLASNPACLAAMERARDTGEIVATSPVERVQETDGGPGLLVFHPIYRNEARRGTKEERRRNLVGFALGVFRVRDMLDPLFREMGAGGIEALVSDRTAPPGEAFLYRHREGTAGNAGPPDGPEMARIGAGFRMDGEMEVPGRRWSVILFPAAGFDTAHGGFRTWGLLGSGLLVTALIVAFLGSSIRRSERIERLAAGLSESNEELQREIAERKATERRISDALELNRRIIEASPLGICTYDSSGQCLSANEAAARILGAEREQVLRQNILRVEPLRSSGVTEKMERILAGEQGDRQEIHTVSTFGKEVWLDLRLAPFSSGGSRCLLLVIGDMSERKRAEQALREREDQLLQARKMEAVGRLAGGIAHDFNNLLLVINGYSSLLLAQIEDGDPRKREAEEILAAGERAAELTRQLLAFSRRQVLQPKLFDLNDLVGAMGGMLRRLIGEHIEFAATLGENLWKVKADPGQIEQILVNLAVNARDAMPAGGTLRISTANVFPDSGFSRNHPALVPGGHVLLAVSDTGTGMDEETRSHIFEPFFTTKETGKGTGLGMATVYGIVNQSGGHIEVESDLGRGTTVRIYFPRSEAAAGEAETGEAAGSLPSGRETVLLAEDEPSVRNLVREILEGRGYTVLSAGDGDEAIRVFGSHAGDVDLLITDVVMPRMGGPELWERISPVRPGMKVLFMSGYAQDSMVHPGLAGPGHGFLQKPFAPDSLVRKVREVLDSPAGSASRE